jgi:tRNA U38,U39,U40 pseudouridine synthase TruA
MEAAFMAIPMRTDWPYKQWQKGTDWELMKKANSFCVNKLRKIVVIQSNANFCNTQIAHKRCSTGRNTATLPKEGPQQLAQEQAGSRKYHQAIEQALNKRLTFDFL